MRHVASIVLCVICLLFVASLTAQEAPPAAGSGWAGKVLVISSRSNVESGAVLENVELRQLGDVWFLVGTHIDTGYPGEWRRGRTVWMAMSDCAQITEFESREAFDAVGRAHAGQQEVEAPF